MNSIPRFFACDMYCDGSNFATTYPRSLEDVFFPLVEFHVEI